MSTFAADIRWTSAPGDDFARGHYSRGHMIAFDGGVTVAASASPHVVGRWAVEAAVDPEEMLVAALSSCHMLSFLHAARQAGFVVAAYDDKAEGVMEDIGEGRMAVTRVVSCAPRFDGRDRRPRRPRSIGCIKRHTRRALLRTP